MMAVDLVLDTHILVDVIYQYYKFEIYNEGEFMEHGLISKKMVDKLNAINKRYIYEEDYEYGVVVTSIFSFVEIARQFVKISADKFTSYQFKAFITECPSWLTITPLSMDIYSYLYYIPKTVVVNGEKKPIEWPDAVHCATYLSRESAYFATEDSRIRAIPDFKFI